MKGSDMAMKFDETVEEEQPTFKRGQLVKLTGPGNEGIELVIMVTKTSTEGNFEGVTMASSSNPNEIGYHNGDWDRNQFVHVKEATLRYKRD